eukprot:COSAG01_NODE_50888_length_359_cov_1.046154_1_plen_61_part_10
MMLGSSTDDDEEGSLSAPPPVRPCCCSTCAQVRGLSSTGLSSPDSTCGRPARAVSLRIDYH